MPCRYRDTCSQLEAATSSLEQVRLERDSLSREMRDVKELNCSMLEEKRMSTIDGKSREATLIAEVETLKGKLRQSSADVSHKDTELAILQRRLELSKEQCSQLERDLSDAVRTAANEHASHSKQKEALQLSLDNSMRTISALQSRYTVPQVVASRSTSHAANALLRNKALEESCVSSVSEWKRKLDAVENDKGSVELEVKDLTSRLAAVEEENRALQTRINQEDKQVKMMKDKFDRLESQRSIEISAMNERMRELEDALSTCKITHRELQQQVEVRALHPIPFPFIFQSISV